MYNDYTEEQLKRFDISAEQMIEQMGICVYGKNDYISCLNCPIEYLCQVEKIKGTREPEDKSIKAVRSCRKYLADRKAGKYKARVSE